MDVTLIQVVSTVLTGIVGGILFVIRSLVLRNEKAAEARDQHIGTLIEGLMKAVNVFQSFEREERKTHTEIVDALERLADAQERVIETQARILATLAPTDGT